MTFSVTTDSLTDFAGVLAPGGHSLNLAYSFSSKAHNYVHSYVPVPDASGTVFAEIYRNNEIVVTQLAEATTFVGELISAASDVLKDSAAFYAGMDEDAAAVIDAAYPTGLAHVPALSPRVSSTAGLIDPDLILDQVPRADAPVPDWTHWILDKSGWISITGVALKILSLFNVDPAGEVTKTFAGNYDELARAGNAARALANFERTAANTLAYGSAAMDWTGNAAAEAQAFFAELVNGLVDHASKLDDLNRKYNLLAEHCNTAAQLVSTALSVVIDRILILVAKLAAAGCLASVPGINVLIAIVGAYEVWVTSEAVRQFIFVTTSIFVAVEGFLLACTGIASAMKSADVTNIFPAAPFVNASI